MTHLGGSSKLLRAMNEAAALGHVLERGPLTRAELRELTGLSKPTISEAVRHLTEARLVTVAGHVSGRPGPNAEVYAINPDAAYSVAISVRDNGESGGPSVSAAACDLTGAVRGRLLSNVDFTRTDPVSAMADTVADVCSTAGVSAEPVGHVQIAVAGSYDHRADVIHHIDLPGWGRRGLVEDLRRRLGAHVEVDNDVNLAAVAERARGAAQDTDGFALLWIGEGGLGLAIDLGGTLLRGTRGGAGEIGYMPVVLPDAHGPRPARRADFQDLVGGAAVLDLAAEHGLRQQSAAFTVAAAVAKAEQRDDAARAFLGAVADRIAIGLAAVVAVLDPPLVVIGGEVGQAGGETLAAAVSAAMSAAAPLETTVAVTALHDDAALLGALEAGRAAIRESILTALRRPHLH